MKYKMKRCKKCKQYTLKEKCPICGEKTGVIYPMKYSPQDKYGKYRRMQKKQAENNNL
ncbi:MAG: RNA-protein complex protein Nop10 [Methanobacteriaceae archaeon]|nr:RNA-protein complex protein Nop10 [Methanobacteriaceae archaeon]